MVAKSDEKSRKCSCGGGSNGGSGIGGAAALSKPTFYERKPNLLRSQKEKRDAATSPQLPNRVADGAMTTSLPSPPPPPPPLASPHPTPIRPSPRREIPMRNAATSPQRDIGSGSAIAKTINPKSPLAVEPPLTGQKPRSPLPAKLMLEKSKSVSETRQARPLRTTRSLSPRPPIRHQQAIIVSDENDIILKVLPAPPAPPPPPNGGADDDEVFYGDRRRAAAAAQRRQQKAKAQSENTSPNISKCDASFFAAAAASASGGLAVTDDRIANNRSTGCLVYVPSDPWMKQPTTARNGGHREKSATLVKNSVNDPWIYRRTTGGDVKKPTLSRQQSKSMSSHIDNSEAVVAATSVTHLKSDVFSPAKTPLPPTPTFAPHSPLTNGAGPEQRKKQAQHFLLNVVNQNVHLQPRHSFSTLMPAKDDELQLNIRRLSEQIKSTSTGYSAALPSPPPPSYINELLLPAAATATTTVATSKSSPLVSKKHTGKSGAAAVVCIEADLVLETTC